MEMCATLSCMDLRGGVGNKDSSAFNMVCGRAKRHPACWEQVRRKTFMSGHPGDGYEEFGFYLQNRESLGYS